VCSRPRSRARLAAAAAAQEDKDEEAGGEEDGSSKAAATKTTMKTQTVELHMVGFAKDAVPKQRRWNRIAQEEALLTRRGGAGRHPAHGALLGCHLSLVGWIFGCLHGWIDLWLSAVVVAL
jgi:hypothetical protein